MAEREVELQDDHLGLFLDYDAIEHNESALQTRKTNFWEYISPGEEKEQVVIEDSSKWTLASVFKRFFSRPAPAATDEKADDCWEVSDFEGFRDLTTFKYQSDPVKPRNFASFEPRQRNFESVFESAAKNAVPGPYVSCVARVTPLREQGPDEMGFQLLENQGYSISGLCCAYYPFIDGFLTTVACTKQGSPLKFMVLEDVKHRAPDKKEGHVTFGKGDLKWKEAQVQNSALSKDVASTLSAKKKRKKVNLTGMIVSFSPDGLGETNRSFQITSVALTAVARKDNSFERMVKVDDKWITSPAQFIDATPRRSALTSRMALSWLSSSNIAHHDLHPLGPVMTGPDILSFPLFERTAHARETWSDKAIQQAKTVYSEWKGTDEKNLELPYRWNEPEFFTNVNPYQCDVVLFSGHMELMIDFPFGIVYQRTDTLEWYFQSPLVNCVLRVPDELKTRGWHLLYRHADFDQVVYLTNGKISYMLILNPHADIVPTNINGSFKTDGGVTRTAALTCDGKDQWRMGLRKSDRLDQKDHKAYEWLTSVLLNRVIMNAQKFKGVKKADISGSEAKEYQLTVTSEVKLKGDERYHMVCVKNQSIEIMRDGAAFQATVRQVKSGELGPDDYKENSVKKAYRRHKLDVNALKRSPDALDQVLAWPGLYIAELQLSNAGGKYKLSNNSSAHGYRSLLTFTERINAAYNGDIYAGDMMNKGAEAYLKWAMDILMTNKEAVGDHVMKPNDVKKQEESKQEAIRTIRDRAKDLRFTVASRPFTPLYFAVNLPRVLPANYYQAETAVPYGEPQEQQSGKAKKGKKKKKNTKRNSNIPAGSDDEEEEPNKKAAEEAKGNSTTPASSEVKKDGPEEGVKRGAEERKDSSGSLVFRAEPAFCEEHALAPMTDELKRQLCGVKEIASSLPTAADYLDEGEEKTALDVISFPFFVVKSYRRWGVADFDPSSVAYRSMFHRYLSLAEDFSLKIKKDELTSYKLSQDEAWFQEVKAHRRELTQFEGNLAKTLSGEESHEDEDLKGRFMDEDYETPDRKGYRIITPINFLDVFSYQPEQNCYYKLWSSMSSNFLSGTDLAPHFGESASGGWRYELDKDLVFRCLMFVLLGIGNTVSDWLFFGQPESVSRLFFSLTFGRKGNKGMEYEAKRAGMFLYTPTSKYRVKYAEQALGVHHQPPVDAVTCLTKRCVPFTVAAHPQPLFWAIYLVMDQMSPNPMDLVQLVYPRNGWRNNKDIWLTEQNRTQPAIAALFAAAAVMELTDHSVTSVIALWINLCAQVTAREGQVLLPAQGDILNVLKCAKVISPDYETYMRSPDLQQGKLPPGEHQVFSDARSRPTILSVGTTEARETLSVTVPLNSDRIPSPQQLGLLMKTFYDEILPKVGQMEMFKTA